jgi:blue copper oxidase
MKRREFVKKSALTAASLSISQKALSQKNIKPTISKPVTAEICFERLELPSSFSGHKSWIFSGKIKSGNANVLKQKKEFSIPILEVNQGDHLKIQYKNNLPIASIIHWHGLNLPEEQVGHPRFLIDQGKEYNYDFEIKNRAGLYWYECITLEELPQYQSTLKGLMIVRDDKEKALNLPTGENEIIIILGQSDFKKNQFNLKSESYRLRLLNLNETKNYTLSWSDLREICAIGTDGGLLDKAYPFPEINLGPGERLDVIVNLENFNLGNQIELLATTVGQTGQKELQALSEFNIVQKSYKKFVLPPILSNYKQINKLEANNNHSVKVFKVTSNNPNGVLINGKCEYLMGDEGAEGFVAINTTEIWQFDLTESQVGQTVHIFGGQFQVLERTNLFGNLSPQMDKGWHDSLSLQPGDRLSIIKRFNIFSGLYLLSFKSLNDIEKAYRIDFLIE